MTLQVLSFGGGVNTAALLALAHKGELKIDYAVFADTGCEYPDTYHWIEEIAKPVCKEMGIPFITIIPKANGVDNLYDYCVKGRTIPTRVPRWCTDKFKIRPLKKWQKENLEKEDYDILLGFDAGESHRARVIHRERYPLIELSYNRKDCKKIIKSVGWPVPPKSGCYLCPFSRIGQWKKLYEGHPDLFAKAEALEKVLDKYPEVRLSIRPLEEIRKKLTNTKQGTLDTWGDWDMRDGFDQGCVMCHV